MKNLILQIQQLLAETADVEREIADVEAAAKALVVTNDDEQALIELIESLRTFARRTREATNRVTFVQHQIEAHLTLMRDAKRAA